MAKQYIDPEASRWHRKYPRFPGVAKCVELLNSSNTRGAWVDTICHQLEQNADEYTSELIAAARREIEHDSRAAPILLNIIADAELVDALPLYAELLQSPIEQWHRYATAGLEQLDTKEARRLLWQQGNR